MCMLNPAESISTTSATVPLRMRRSSSRRRRIRRGKCLMGAMKPMTACETVCWISCTPASRIASPPTPTREKGAPAWRSARATAAACRSPDTSPTTKRISRTRRRARASGAPGLRALDVGDDLQGDRERLAPLLPGHGDRALSADRREEALELQAERLSLLGFEGNALHELLQREGRRGERLHVHVVAQAEELPVARGQVERDVLAFLED